MNVTDKTRTIAAVRAIGPSVLHVSWSDGTAADIELGAILDDRAFAALRDPGEFAKVELGDWGHSLTWPSGVELGADMLWLETLSATGHGDVRAFLAWRLRPVAVEGGRRVGRLAPDGHLLFQWRKESA